MGSKKTQIVSLRLENEIVERLKQMAGELSLAEYIKRVISVNTPFEATAVKSVNTDEVSPKQEKLEALRELISNVEVSNEPVRSTRIPLYNAALHKAGDRVQMPSGEIVTVPELDAGGSSLSPYEGEGVNRLVSDNLFKPSFQPDVKVVRVKKGKKW